MTQAAPANNEAPPTYRPSKCAIVTKLLSRPRGASLGDINNVTGWQAHSIRSFLTGLRKKGIVLSREQRRDGVTGYRIVKTNPVAQGETPESSGD
jgi:hypothetical protein